MVHDALRASALRRSTPGAANLGTAQNALWELRIGVSQFVSAKTPEDQQKIIDQTAGIKKTLKDAMAAYRKTSTDASERAVLAQRDSVYPKYRDARPRFLELYGAGKTEEAIGGAPPLLCHSEPPWLRPWST